MAAGNFPARMRPPPVGESVRRLGLPPHGRRAPGAAAFPAFGREAGTPCSEWRSRSAASLSLPASLNRPKFSRSGWAPRGGPALAAAGRPAPQHCLNLRPLPHGQRSLRPVRAPGAAARSLITGPPAAFAPTYPAALPRRAGDFLECALRRNHAMPSNPPRTAPMWRAPALRPERQSGCSPGSADRCWSWSWSCRCRPGSVERVEIHTAGGEIANGVSVPPVQPVRRRIALADAEVADIDCQRADILCRGERCAGHHRTGLHGIGRTARGIGAAQQSRAEDRHRAGAGERRIRRRRSPIERSGLQRPPRRSDRTAPARPRSGRSVSSNMHSPAG